MQALHVLKPSAHPECCQITETRVPCVCTCLGGVAQAACKWYSCTASSEDLTAQVSPKAFAAGAKEQEAGEMSLQGTAIEVPESGTPSMKELKVLYYESMIRFHKHSNNYIEIVRCLLALYSDASAEGKEDGASG